MDINIDNKPIEKNAKELLREIQQGGWLWGGGMVGREQKPGFQ